MTQVCDRRRSSGRSTEAGPPSAGGRGRDGIGRTRRAGRGCCRGRRRAVGVGRRPRPAAGRTERGRRRGPGPGGRPHLERALARRSRRRARRPVDRPDPGPHPGAGRGGGVETFEQHSPRCTTDGDRRVRRCRPGRSEPGHGRAGAHGGGASRRCAVDRRARPRVGFADLAQLVAGHPITGPAAAYVHVVMAELFTAEPAEVSLLHVLNYVRSAGSCDHLLHVAQERRFVAGSQEISVRVAQRLGDDAVQLGHPVRRLIQDGRRGGRSRRAHRDGPLAPSWRYRSRSATASATSRACRSSWPRCTSGSPLARSSRSTASSNARSGAPRGGAGWGCGRGPRVGDLRQLAAVGDAGDHRRVRRGGQRPPVPPAAGRRPACCRGRVLGGALRPAGG